MEYFYTLKIGEPEKIKGKVIEYRADLRLYSSGLPDDGQPVFNRKNKISKKQFGVSGGCIDSLFKVKEATPTEVTLEYFGWKRNDV